MSTGVAQFSIGTARDRLLTRGARRWYAGATFGLAYQAIEIAAAWSSTGSAVLKAVATAALVVLYLGYLAVPPLVWPEPERRRVLALLAYWALTCALFPLVGPTAVWVWTLIAAMLGFARVGYRSAYAMLGALVAAQIAVAWALGWPDSVSFAPFITATVGSAMIAFGHQIEQNVRLRAAQAEIARLAVLEERGRLARDLHDSLGHALTVVAIKAELGAKLLPSDTTRAAAELDDIADLARSGLADLRGAVAGFRAADLDAELAAARLAFTAAGIQADLPADARAAAADARPLFAWVLRESVTNVIRHSAASRVEVDLGVRRLAVRDDGRGPDPLRTSAGSGLRGLRERADAAGAELHCGAAATGGFEVVVELAAR